MAKKKAGQAANVPSSNVKSSGNKSSGSFFKSMARKSAPPPSSTDPTVIEFLGNFWKIALLLFSLYSSYRIRLHAVNIYGRVIHEFDPWFNFRATEYLVEHGIEKFFTWYDEMSWYPLGRLIGTTIYPGLQMTAAAMWWLGKTLFGGPGGYFEGLTLNDVCVFIPAIFGVVATAFTGLLAYEVSGNLLSSALATAIMAVLPAHLMRSVAGGFDNECIAISALVSTFYLWCRAVRSPNKTWPLGVLAAASYVYMVAAWGGYTFVLNMVGLHALLMAVQTVDLREVASRGVAYLSFRDPSGLHKAYSLFYVLGTAGAVQFPVVGWAPLKSLEQLGPLLVFVGLQLLALNHKWRKANSKVLTKPQMLVAAVKVALLALLAGSALGFAAAQVGYLGPLSSRVRGLFVQHTRTGNPLVDSVAEHQSTRPEMYFAYFHLACWFGPLGLLVALVGGTGAAAVGSGSAVSSSGEGAAGAPGTNKSGRALFKARNNATWFLALYALVAYYFSQKMVRLVLLLAPPAAILGGLGLGGALTWAHDQLLGSNYGDFILGGPAQIHAQGYASDETVSDDDVGGVSDDDDDGGDGGNGGGTVSSGGPVDSKSMAAVMRARKAKGGGGGSGGGGGGGGAGGGGSSSGGGGKKGGSVGGGLLSPLGQLDAEFTKELKRVYNASRTPRQIAAAVVAYFCVSYSWSFVHHATSMSFQLSNPSIMVKGRNREGNPVMIDDFREAYWWLRDHTPPDARVMSWWDYGYQLNGMSNRTTLADGNTWNHEHIALLGKALVSPVPEAHKIARHLADYVLVWSTHWGGMPGDDVAKSPHMARIGASVYADVKAENFWMERNGEPSPMMRESLVYNLVNYRLDPNVPTAHFFDPSAPDTGDDGGGSGSGGLTKTTKKKPSKQHKFQEVYTTTNSMVRIFKVLKVSKASKRYCAEGHHGRRAWSEGRPLTDAYPPALRKVLASKQDFAQLEDFNAQKRNLKAGSGGGSGVGSLGGNFLGDEDEDEEDNDE